MKPITRPWSQQEIERFKDARQGGIRFTMLSSAKQAYDVDQDNGAKSGISVSRAAHIAGDHFESMSAGIGEVWPIVQRDAHD